jgi:REP element-mobilizing transposase RayT
MPRPHRPDLHGAWYHVINRGADRQDVFSCDADFAYFETLMADAVATHGIQIHAYSLMDNHFHQLMHCPEGGLSAAMKDIQSVYVGSYNHHHERTGPMFEGRFTSRLVDGSAALHLTGRYIHRNPLDIVPSHSLANYRWSSFRHYASGSVAPNWLTTSELDGQFQNRSAYERYVLTSHPSDKQAERLGSPAALGRLDALDEHVAAICGVAVDNLRLRNLDNTARLLAITLAVEVRILGSDDLAVHYDLGSAGSVRATARRGRVRLADDLAFASLRHAVLNGRFDRVAKGA